MDNTLLYCGDCNVEMENIPEKSVDLIFADIPYATKSFGRCVDCEWDKPLDLEKMWINIKRIRKDTTPIFFTCNMKLAVDLINSNKKEFRYDLIWIKSAPVGFLSARKMPMRKHELVLCFYKKLPFYDLSSHKHKFITKKESIQTESVYGGGIVRRMGNKESKYEPKLPNSIIHGKTGETIYGNNIEFTDFKGRNGGSKYSPPLPVSIIKEDVYGERYKKGRNKEIIKDGSVKEETESLYGNVKTPEYVSNNIERNKLRREYKKEGDTESAYSPPLPTSVIKDNIYGFDPNKMIDERPSNKRSSVYSPPLPVSVIKDNKEKEVKFSGLSVSEGGVETYKQHKRLEMTPNIKAIMKETGNGQRYIPPMPTSIISLNVEEPKKEIEYNEDKDKMKELERTDVDVNLNIDMPEPKEDVYNYQKRISEGKLYKSTTQYNPKLPTSVVQPGIYGDLPTTNNYAESVGINPMDKHKKQYEPALPTSLLKIKSSKGRHATEKPVGLMSWCLKYYSKPGDVVLDFCMGSGSTGVSCVQEGRNFIGIEQNPDIFEVACQRIYNPEERDIKKD